MAHIRPSMKQKLLLAKAAITLCMSRESAIYKTERNLHTGGEIPVNDNIVVIILLADLC